MSNITLGKKYNLMAMSFSYWQPFRKKKKQHFSRMWKFLAHMACSTHLKLLGQFKPNFGGMVLG
jgi:hypothetical protein